MRLFEITTEVNRMFHGTDQVIDTLRVGSWVTDDYEVALEFARDKSQTQVYVYEFDIAENLIDWDIMSMVSGVEDNRGTLIVDFALDSAIIHKI